MLIASENLGQKFQPSDGHTDRIMDRPTNYTKLQYKEKKKEREREKGREREIAKKNYIKKEERRKNLQKDLIEKK